MNQWVGTEYELDLFQQDPEAFVPRRIFDAQVHLYDVNHFPELDILPLHRRGPIFVGANALLKYIDRIHPGRHVTGLCLPYPRTETDFEAAHNLISTEITKLESRQG